MREVAVIGVGQSAFGKFPWRTAADLGAEAVRAAIEDCGISPKAIQVAYCARAYDANCTAQGVLKEVGIRDIEMINVENACAGGATSFRGVWKEIADGRYDVGIAMGVESMTTSPIAGRLIPPEKTDLGRPPGADHARDVRHGGQKADGIRGHEGGFRPSIRQKPSPRMPQSSSPVQEGVHR